MSERTDSGRAGGRATTRRRLLAAVKLLVSVALIYWIVSRSSLEESVSAMGAAHLGILSLAFLLNLAVPTSFRTLRWHLIMRSQGLEVRDGLRLYDAVRATDDKGKAAATVVVDRIVGVLSMLLVALAVLPFADGVRARISFLRTWIVADPSSAGSPSF